MQLTQQTLIRRSDSRYSELEQLCHLSKNLYNTGLYRVRQHYFEHHTYLNYYDLYQLLKSENNSDLRALPSQTAQQVLRQIDQSFRSFYSLWKKGMHSKIPKYQDKEGNNTVVYTSQQIRKKPFKNGVLSLPGLESTFRTRLTEIDLVRIVPHKNHICLELVYTVPEPSILPDNGRVAAIDLGLDNLATMVFSDGAQPVLVSGRPVKSMNQYYNKNRSKLQSVGATRKAENLTSKRNRKMKDQLHKTSHWVVNHVAENQYHTLVVGYNKGWKQDTTLGTRTNQQFVSVPHYQLLQMLEYKCKLRGIKLVVIDEAYTSKASALDLDRVPSLGEEHSEFSGRRAQRGLYVTREGLRVNADVNGALNIMRKVTGDEIEVLSPAGRGLVFSPVRVTIT